MTIAVQNYGTLLKKGTTTLAEVVSITPPSVTNEPVEVTNHGSGGWKEYISGGLKELGEFKVKVNWIPNNGQYAVASGILYDVTNGVKATYSLVFPTSPATTWSFDCYVVEIAPEEIDAQNPEGLGATITFRPTGTPTLA